LFGRAPAGYVGPMQTTDQHHLLAIYLNDQLALSIGWRNLARRTLDENRSSPLGADLRRLAEGFAEDTRTLERLMARRGIRRSRVKPALAVAAERLGRLKPNGRLRTYSPLSRLAELDALMLALESKRLLWRALRDARIAAPGVDYDSLIERSDRQHRFLETHRDGEARGVLRIA
jgi:hypothetical protein